MLAPLSCSAFSFGTEIGGFQDPQKGMMVATGPHGKQNISAAADGAHSASTVAHLKETVDWSYQKNAAVGGNREWV
jgi:hypothetical protein